MNFDDPSVKRFSQVVLGLLLMALFTIACFTLAIVVEFLWSGLSENDADSVLMKIAAILPKQTGPEVSQLGNIVGLLVAAVPLMVTPVCFNVVGDARRLNRFGTFMMAVLSVTLLVAAVAYVGIRPTDWERGHSLGKDGLSEVREWANTALKGSVFYICALLGLKGVR